MPQPPPMEFVFSRGMTVLMHQRTVWANEWLHFGHFDDDGDDDEFMTMIIYISPNIPVRRHWCLPFGRATGSMSGKREQNEACSATYEMSPLKWQQKCDTVVTKRG